MIPILLIPPAVEPILLVQAKNWLRIDHADEDELVAALIASARLVVESASGRMLISQTWRIVMDVWPEGDIVIPLAPVRQVVALRTLTAAGVSVVIAPSSYVASAAGGLGRIRFLTKPPEPERTISGIEIDVELGFSSNSQGVPETLKTAMRLLIARWYEQRGDVESDGAFERMPPAVAALIAPYRRMRIA
jgi:uncharacterized phiE125 gp8 family phage protein